MTDKEKRVIAAAITGGGHAPREKTLEKICEVLGVSVEEVCE